MYIGYVSRSKPYTPRGLFKLWVRHETDWRGHWFSLLTAPILCLDIPEIAWQNHFKNLYFQPPIYVAPLPLPTWHTRLKSCNKISSHELRKELKCIFITIYQTTAHNQEGCIFHTPYNASTGVVLKYERISSDKCLSLAGLPWKGPSFHGRRDPCRG